MKTDHIYWLAAALILGMAVYSANAKAETSLYAGAWSTHLLTDEDYNEEHDLMAVEHKRVFAARFKNSYDRESYALGYTWTKSWGNVEGKVVAGAVSGYTSFYGNRGDSSKVLPLVVPMVSYTKWRVQPTVLLMGEALAFSVRFEL